MPYGERAPTRPVASWSRLTLPTKIPPASTRRCTTGADAAGTYAMSGHATVVGTPATSMLSFTANGIPKSGLAWPASRRADARFDGRVQVARADEVQPHVLHALPVPLDAGEDLVDHVVRGARPGSIGCP